MLSGIRLLISQPCSAPCNLENIGKAVKMASATVKNGTSAIEVVKVRLLAVRPMWSSRKRSRRVMAVWRHGKWDRSVNNNCKDCGTFIPVSCHRQSDKHEQSKPN